MMWGAMSVNRLSDLVEVPGILNGEKYRDILRSHLIPRFGLRNNSRKIFMQDSAPPHRPAKTFLENEGVQVLDWPPQSPDLNPIENIWGLLKRKFRSKFDTKVDLVDFVRKHWNDIEESYPEKLYASIPTRIEAVIKMKGGAIPY